MLPPQHLNPALIRSAVLFASLTLGACVAGATWAYPVSVDG